MEALTGEVGLDGGLNGVPEKGLDIEIRIPAVQNVLRTRDVGEFDSQPWSECSKRQEGDKGDGVGRVNDRDRPQRDDGWSD